MWCMVLAVALAGCGTEDSPPSGPAECGEGVQPGSVESLLRWPYLQSVTSRSAVIAWATSDNADLSEVRVGRDPSYARRVPAETEWVPGATGLMALHSVAIDGLHPATEYCYKVVTDGVELAGALRFRTALEDPDSEVTFLALGDYGSGSEEQKRVRDQMNVYREEADLLLTTGDNAYPLASDLFLQVHLFDVYRELMMRIPLFPVLGNHDVAADDGAPYLNHFFLPQNTLREEDREKYYSIDWGPIHFVALDSERSQGEAFSTDGTNMRDWLEADLAAADSPWKIVAFHRPPYSNHPTRTPNGIAQRYFVPLFETYGVQLVLTGHNHFYERFHPFREGARTSTASGGVTYVVTGGGGAGLYDIVVGKDPLQAVGSKSHHFIVGNVIGCVMTVQAIDLDGQVLDQFEMERCG